MKVLILAALSLAQLFAADLQLPVRGRVEPFKGSGAWREVQLEERLPVAETALLICDLWDHHWCSGSEKRVGLLAPKVAAVVERARARGIQIVHAPSDVVEFYKDYPQRRVVLETPKTQPPADLQLPNPPLPIDDTGGGCETGEHVSKPYPWTRQHAAVSITGRDIVSANGQEIYSVLASRGIRYVLFAGVHTNFCILHRNFGIKQMTRWGLRPILIRDLTDAMYDPAKRPFVSHERGTELVIEYIEQNWCPTVLSADVTKALEKLR